MTPEQKEAIRIAKARVEAIRAAQAKLQVSDTSTMKGRIASARDGTLKVNQEALKRQAGIDQIAMDRMTLAQNGGAAVGTLTKFNQGLPFVGEYMDEAAELVQEGAGQRMRDIRGAMDREYPKTSMGAEIAGGVAGSIPLVASGVGAAAKAPGLIGKTAAAVGLGAAGGGSEGLVAGFGSGTDAESRKSKALEQGVTGAAVGGLLSGLAPIVGSGVKAIYRRVKRLDVSVIADELGVDKRTAAVIKKHLINDDLDAASDRLSAIGDDAMLADAGMGTAQALDTAAQTGGKALRTAKTAVEGRAEVSGKKLAAALDRILGKPKGVKTSARDIASRTSGVRRKAYDVAYSQAVDYSQDAGRKIEAVLDRIPSKTLKSAVDEANEAMQAAGLKNQQILAEIATDGSVSFREMPNVRQIDEIKKALGNTARAEVDNFGRMSAAGIRANKLASELRAAASDAVPSYARAVKLGGDKIAEDQALDIGRRLLSAKTPVEDVAAVMRGASQETKLAAKQGLRENIDTVLSNVRRTITDENVDAREAMTLIKDLSSKANKRKLRYVLGHNGTQALFKEMEQAEAALALRVALAQNSKTAIRQAGQSAMNDATTPGAVRTLLSGSPVEASRKVVQALTGATDEAAVAMREDVAAQIAEALTGIRGKDAQKALRMIKQAMEGQPLKDAEAQFIARVVGVPTISATHQSATQFLED